ncbi:MAG: MlaE family lipid ABC transporter permease subunit [Verrucomicrobiota bacterium]
MSDARRTAAGLTLREEAGGLAVEFSGDWLMRGERPGFEQVRERIEALGSGKCVRLVGGKLEQWDTALLIFVRRCRRAAEGAGQEVELEALPEGARRLLELSLAADQEGAEAEPETGWMTAVGRWGQGVVSGVGDCFAFLGELALDLKAFAGGRSQQRLKDFLYLLQQTGARALPIVCLLSFLTGLIIAFIGVIQLQKFAADIYVADLVGLATTRELGAVMAGVIMAGRTGAAFAAQIGSMQVNEEVDALATFGISPMRFLVVPRVVALVLMMPLLCTFADFVAILGGMVVAMAISDVSAVQYVNQVEAAVGLSDLLVGIFKSGVFGVIIALAGCYRGLNCGRDATSVGLAATSAVVTAITWIVVADAVFAVMFHVLGI